MKVQYPQSHSPTHLAEGSLGLGCACDTISVWSPEKKDCDLVIWRDGQNSIFRSTRFPTVCTSGMHTVWCIVAECIEFDELERFRRKC